MGKAKGGILGEVSGLVGNVEFYVMNGKTYARAKKKMRNKRSKNYLSTAQRAQLWKMNVLSPFLNKATEFFQISFREKTRETEVFNTAATAKGLNLMTGIKGEKPNWEINWEGITVAAGPLRIPENIKVTTTEKGFEFEWELGEHLTSKDYNHRAMILAYKQDEKRGDSCVYELSGAKRKELKDSIKISKYHKGKSYQLFLAFMDTFSQQVSNSVYCGEYVF